MHWCTGGKDQYLSGSLTPDAESSAIYDEKQEEDRMETIEIRKVTEKDAGELLNIYAPYVTDTAVTFEYTVPTEDEFRSRIIRTLEKFPYLAAVLNGEIAGYAYAGPFHPRAAYGWAVETTVYVKKDKKRMGIGKKLYCALEKVLMEQNILNLYACIACPEKEDEYLTRDSIRFHERLGYRMIGEFYQCGYKFERWYNMVWMEKHIGAHAEKPADVVPFPEIRQKTEHK